MKTTVNNSGSDLIIKVKDILISYDDMGQGELPVIFIHGFPFDKSSWRQQVEGLSTNFRVLAYDIRGFGKSESGSDKFTIGLFAQDLIDFMDVLNIQKAVVCGLSMGGYILMNAVHYHPDRFAAIILCDTQCIADSDEARNGRYNTIKTIGESGLAGFTEAFVKKVFCNTTLENNPALVQKIKDVIMATAVDSVTGTLGALAAREEMCTKIKMFSGPALILCGAADVVTPPDQSALLQKNIEGSEMQLIKDAGHLSNLEQPVDFNGHILRFVSRQTS